jgi:hypothetical protein
MGAGQRRTTEIARGLFAVRYVGADDSEQPPLVRITVEPDSEAHVDMLLHPDHEEGVLTHPGTCLIVRAMMPGTLAVEVEPRNNNGSIAATINIEPLTQGEAVASAPRGSRQPAARRIGAATEDIRILGHIAGIGDVYANANEWLAGPTAPSRIEGISIEWPTKPEGVDIRYSVKTAQPLNISGRILDLGAFAGTRGRAMPLTNVMLELSGPDALLYQFAVEGLFLGAPVMHMSGERVVLSGPTGREPLVGLRVVLEEAGAQNDQMRQTSRVAQTSQATQTSRARPTSQKNQSPQQPAPAVSAPTSSSGRVRVFRSRPKDKPAT